MNLNDIIKELNSSNSTNHKIEVLEKHKNNENFKKLLSLVYDPQYNFYIKNITKKTISNIEEKEKTIDNADEAIIDFLTKLSSGEIQRGNIARGETITFIGNLTKEYQEIFINALNRDLKVGINVKSINKAMGDNFIDIPPYMRCSLPDKSNIDKFNWSSGVYLQEKADGMFINIIIDKDGNISLRTRSGTKLSDDVLMKIKNDIRFFLPDLRDHTICGELLVTINGIVQNRQTGNGILNSIIQNGVEEKDDYSVICVVWDIYKNDHKNETRYYGQRFETLKNVFPKFEEFSKYRNNSIFTITSNLVYSKSEAMAITNKLISQGKEGSVIKNQMGLFKNGTSKDQVKLKVEFDCELRIVEMTEGKGKNEELFGSLICESEDKKLKVAVSGFTDEMRKEIFDNFDNYKDKIITVCSNGIIEDKNRQDQYSLFLPRFVEIRFDKDEADTIEKIIEQSQNFNH